jgi:hypothetical protein
LGAIAEAYEKENGYGSQFRPADPRSVVALPVEKSPNPTIFIKNTPRYQRQIQRVF